MPAVADHLDCEPKSAEEKPRCFGDLRREQILATQAPPPEGKHLNLAEFKLVEPWSEYHARKQRERGLKSVETKPAETKRLAPGHIENMRKGQQRRRERERAQRGAKMRMCHRAKQRSA